MHADLERGNRLELPWLQGVVPQSGRDHAIATPGNDFVGDVLALYLEGAPAAVSA
jgi:2-dehydropantoate 2-reductase